MEKQAKGKEAEAAAHDFLAAKGLQVICENFRCKVGELDLVAIYKGTLIVVEVRMRSRRDFGTAAESITNHKRQRIIQATKFFLLQRPELRRFPVRFDVVAFDTPSESNPKGIVWLKDAFQAPQRR